MGNAGDKILYSSESLAAAARRLQQVGAALQRETGGLLSTLGQLDGGNGGDCRIQGRIHLTTVGATYSAGTIEGFIREISRALNAEGDYARNLAGRVKKVSEAFEKTEKDLAALANGISTGDDPFGGAGGGADADDAWRAIIDKLVSLIGIGGSFGIGGKILGIDWSMLFGGSLLSGTFSPYANAVWDPAGGNILAGAGLNLSGYLAQGTYNNQFGIFSSKGSFTAITGAIIGDIGGSLMQNGKIMPAIWAGVSGEATALKFDMSNRFGNDQFNWHPKTEGSLLTAFAKADGRVGASERVTENGKTINELGIEGEYGYGAYLAKLRGEQGITIFGVDIDVGMDLGLGGAGASAGGKISTSEVKFDVELGLGAGIGIDVNIDWGDCDFYNLELPSLSDLNWFG